MHEAHENIRQPEWSIGDESWLLRQAFNVEQLDATDFWNAVANTQDFWREVRIVEQGRAVKPAKDIPSLAALESRYDDGATLVVRGVERYSWQIYELCRWFREVTDTRLPFSAHAYLTGPRQPGLQQHYDGQDGFIVQVSGSKHWEVCPPINQFQTIDHLLEDDELVDPPALVTDLYPGDCLCLRSGLIHKATANEQPSFHLTFGVDRDLLERERNGRSAALLECEVLPAHLGQAKGEHWTAWRERIQDYLVSAPSGKEIAEMINTDFSVRLGPRVGASLINMK